MGGAGTCSAAKKLIYRDAEQAVKRRDGNAMQTATVTGDSGTRTRGTRGTDAMRGHNAGAVRLATAKCNATHEHEHDTSCDSTMTGGRGAVRDRVAREWFGETRKRVTVHDDARARYDSRSCGSTRRVNAKRCTTTRGRDAVRDRVVRRDGMHDARGALRET